MIGSLNLRGAAGSFSKGAGESQLTVLVVSARYYYLFNYSAPEVQPRCFLVLFLFALCLSTAKQPTPTMKGMSAEERLGILADERHLVL